MQKNSLHRLTNASLCAALYAAMTLALPMLSYGQVQFRISEVLTLLPLFSPTFVWGLPVGCLIANLFSPLGWMDLVFGTSATLLAAVLTRAFRHVKFGKLPILSMLMPVICNTVFIGAEIGLLTENATPLTYVYSGLSVGAGELVVCLGLGIPFYLLIQRSRLSDVLRKA